VGGCIRERGGGDGMKESYVVCVTAEKTRDDRRCKLQL
jgi:hypothetical protein